MKPSQWKRILAEFGEQIERKKWSRYDVIELRGGLDGLEYEEARLYTWCVLNNYDFSCFDDGTTVEEARTLIEPT